MQNRNNFLKQQLCLTSGTSSNAIVKQTAKLVKGFNFDEKQKIMKSANLPSASISAEALISMKVDLGIPWEKLNKMGRYYV